MRDNAQWRFFRDSLYHLKRAYGVAVTVIKLRDSETDYQTGDKTIFRNVYPVERAIMFPDKIDRRVEQGISPMSANKYVVSQGGFDRVRTNFLFDASDLPPDFEFELDDFIVSDMGYCQVVEIEEYEEGTGWLVKTHLAEGADLSRVVPLDGSNAVEVRH